MNEINKDFYCSADSYCADGNCCIPITDQIYSYTYKEIPIIFKPEMVKAILEGAKTQTRRIIKVPPCEIHEHGGTVSVTKPRKFKNEYARLCPYEPYHVGDTLWVRERFCNVNKKGIKPEYYYFADTLFQKIEDYNPKEWTWQPSIHMKREAARIFLEIISISVGRIQEIGEKDAKAEGVHPCFWFQPFGKPEDESITFDNNQPTHKAAFFNLWDKINAERGYSWESNPWVWVIEFRRKEAE